jgi:hypothetical protein
MKRHKTKYAKFITRKIKRQITTGSLNKEKSLIIIIIIIIIIIKQY